MLSQEEYKIKWVTEKQSLLTRAQIFEKHEIEGIKDKTCKIFYELWLAKKSSNANILMCQIWAKKYMKTDLTKVSFTN